MFVVTVLLNVKKEYFDEFLKIVKENAEVSKRIEKGCLHFDVCYSGSVINHIFLYEIYDSEIAFKLHLDTKHFNKFNSKTQNMILAKTIKTYSELS